MRHLSELIELLQTSDTEHRREATFDFLLNIGCESVVNQEDSMLMLTLLKDPDNSVRLNAINIFKILSEEKGNRDILSEIENMKACIQLFKDPNYDIKRGAVLAFSNFLYNPTYGKLLMELDVLSSFISLLQNKGDNEIRIIVSRSLHRLMCKLEFKLYLLEEDQLSILIEALEDDEKEVQTLVLLVFHSLLMDEKTSSYVNDNLIVSKIQSFYERSTDILLRTLTKEMLDLCCNRSKQAVQHEKKVTTTELASRGNLLSQDDRLQGENGALLEFLIRINDSHSQQRPRMISNSEGLKLNSLFLSVVGQLKNNAADLILKLSMIEKNRLVLVDAGVIFSCINALPSLNDIFVIKTLKILKNIFNEKDSQVVFVDAGGFEILVNIIHRNNILLNRIVMEILKVLLSTYSFHKIFLKEENRVNDIINLLEGDQYWLLAPVIVILFYFSANHEVNKELFQEKLILKIQSLKKSEDKMIKEFSYLIADNCQYVWKKYFVDQQIKEMLEGNVNYSDYISSSNALVALPVSRFASGGADGIVIWDLRTKRCEKILQSDDRAVLKLMLLPDHILLSYHPPNLMNFWDWRKGECIRTVSEGRTLEAFTILSNNRLVTSSEDSYPIKIWARSYKYSVLDFRSFRGAPVSIVGINDEKIACAYHGYNDIYVLDTDKKERKISDKVFSGHIKPVFEMLMLQNGWLASLSEDNTIKFWDVGTRQCLNTINLTGRSLSRLVTMGSYYLVGFSSEFSQNSSIKIWDIRNLSLLKSIESLYIINDAIIVFDFVLLLSLKLSPPSEEKLTTIDFSEIQNSLMESEDGEPVLSNNVKFNEVFTPFSFFNLDQSLAHHYSTIRPAFSHRCDVSNDVPTFNPR